MIILQTTLELAGVPKFITAVIFLMWRFLGRNVRHGHGERWHVYSNFRSNLSGNICVVTGVEIVDLSPEVFLRWVECF